MIDTTIQENLIKGMIKNGEGLRDDEKTFLKIQGINETIEKSRTENIKNEADLTKAKDELKALKAKKKEAVQVVAGKIAEKMGHVLPIGEAVFDVGENVFIGWKIGEKITPFDGLSGGQEQIFSLALAHTLKANILVLEAGELDDKHLETTLFELSKLDSQVIVNTCHNVYGDTLPENFNVIELGA